MKKLLIVLPLFVIILFSCAKAEKIENSGKNHPLAPQFTLEDLRGGEISLSDLKGKVIFLNFWATWCGPCRVEIPDFVDVYSENKTKGMEIIGVSLDRVGTKSLLSFVEEFKINYPVALATPKIVNDYQPGRFIPATIIIDKKGKIRHKHIGPMNKKTLNKYFLELVEED
ncbi:MAG: TlpA disulfide reductase family protein [Candidatus Aminicenantaceae bacterium]